MEQPIQLSSVHVHSNQGLDRGFLAALCAPRQLKGVAGTTTERPERL